MDKDFQINFDPKYEGDKLDELEQFDEFVELIRPQIEEEEAGTSVIVPQKMSQIQFVYNILKYLAKGTGLVITYSLHQPFRSVGSIRIEGKEIVFSDMKWILRAIEFCSNVEVYPLTNGDIRMTFTFHGLVKPLE